MSAGQLSRLAAGAMLVAAAFGAYWVHVRGAIELSPEALRAQVESLGPIAPLVFVGLLAARPFLGLPSWLFMLAAGLLFGVVGGTIVSTLGGTLGGILAFFVARSLGRDAVSERIKGRIAQIDEKLSQQGPPWLAAYTAVPISVLTPVFLVAGLTGIGVVPFAVAVSLGFAPRAALYAYFGAIALDPGPRDLWIASGLVVLAILAVLASRRFLFSPVERAAPPSG